jgi:hypothetical protein
MGGAARGDVIRALIACAASLVVGLTACSMSTDPYACVPEGGYGCDTLPPPVIDSLLPLPDSVAP